MSNILYLDSYRPSKASDDDKIVVRWQADGSYRVTIEGIYAENPPIAVEALADIIQTLAIAARIKSAN